jgi:hypothetical protein
MSAILIALGASKKKPALPPSLRRKESTSPPSVMPAMDSMQDDDDDGDDDDDQDDLLQQPKVGRDQAGFIEAARSCANCEYWHSHSGECDKVDGTFDPNDRCEVFFEPVQRTASLGGMPPHQESLELPPEVPNVI